MRDTLMYSNINGELFVVVPLYRRHYEDEMEKLAGYTISLSSDQPVAYAIDTGLENLTIVNSNIIDRNLKEGSIEIVGEF